MSVNPLADLLKDLPRPYNRLAFELQCGYYAALRLDVPQAVVAAAAGISQPTISHLKNAGKQYRGLNRFRYANVAAEYHLLGKDAFIKKYLTPVIREALAQAIDAHNRKANDPDLNDRGFNPRATRFVGRQEWPQTSLGMHVIFRIHLAPDRHGYVWRNLKPFQLEPEIPEDQVNFNSASQPQGNPERDNGRLGFATSQDCYRYLKQRFDPKPEK